MSNHTTYSGGGIDLLGVLTVVFITLKSTGLIDWSWWLVLLPLWISLGLILTLLGIVLVLAKRGV